MKEGRKAQERIRKAGEGREKVRKEGRQDGEGRKEDETRRV